MSARPWYVVLAEGVAGPDGLVEVESLPLASADEWLYYGRPRAFRRESEAAALEMLHDWPSWALPRS